MGRILIGLGMVVIGAFMTIKANALYEALGPVPWAEEHLGSEGGSRLMYKLIGIGFCVVGFLLATGLLTSLILTIASYLFPQLRQIPR